MIAKVYCKRCNKLVQRETHKQLKHEYKYYCPHCYENMHSFETYKKKRGEEICLRKL